MKTRFSLNLAPYTLHLIPCLNDSQICGLLKRDPHGSTIPIMLHLFKTLNCYCFPAVVGSKPGNSYPMTDPGLPTHFFIGPRNPRSLGVVRDQPLCQRKSPLERWSNGVLEYWKRFALPLSWRGKLNSLFVSMHKDWLAIGNAQNFQGRRIFRWFSCHCFSVLH
jgi:hypothetical protein